MAFRLSENPFKCTEFLRGLGTSPYNSGDMWNSQTVLILHYIVNVNYIFVVAYKLIAFHPLHPKLKMEQDIWYKHLPGLLCHVLSTSGLSSYSYKVPQTGF